MNTRWLKALAILTAAGASAAAVSRLRQDLSGRGLRPGLTPIEEGIPGAAPAPGPAESGAIPPEEEPTPEIVVPLPDETALSPPSISAREAAVLYAFDTAGTRAQAGERIVVLSVGSVKERGIDGQVARVAVPLELSIRTPERVPRTEHVTLLVTLEGSRGAWQVVSHEWE